ncbi:MAG: hypothetical protein QNJ98_20735 [Planctomycetota bacterium]|nr:hypothetical protein [Planctomycetota bacterium]
MSRSWAWLLLLAVLVAGVSLWNTDRSEAEEPDAKAKSAAAFQQVARVLRHPRCLNCHPSGDRPRVGEKGELHAQNVQRGPKNHGMPGMHCAACHHATNQEIARVPGAPHWSLAPRSQGWEGLDDHDLAVALKDPKLNGGRSLQDLLKHVREDKLVLWGWDPGRGRAPVPLTHADFVKAFETWIANGAVEPAKGTTSRFGDGDK